LHRVSSETQDIVGKRGVMLIL